MVQKEERKIIIMGSKNDPAKVIAKDLLTKKTGEARCSEEDTYDFMTGAMIALSRLAESEKREAFKKPCKFEVGDIIVGNKNANRYGLTREGWVGVVTEVFAAKDGMGCDKGRPLTFKARSANGKIAYELCDDAFDLA